MYRVRRHRPPSLLDARLIWSPFAGKLAEMGFSYDLRAIGQQSVSNRETCVRR
jgi:hypothetical protein